ncbi:large ribosomal subunit protein bL17m [Trichomonascus vanleenenianus]|uniref:mitochondrial 54S ribosomal protein bL17m MRPL8 n=1 Tax=Trichomonascus vanleenenianus TaxID=2268995 RepID=UPI003ECA48F6
MTLTRKLGRTPAHRRSLLRNLVTDLFEYESITTTHGKAKEAQASAEWLITLAKHRSPNLEAAKARANDMIFRPSTTLPKLFDDLAKRYKDRTGGYTRVLKLEARQGDNAPQSILELVGGPRDMRFSMTARVVARLEEQGQPIDMMTQKNIDSILKYKTEDQFRAEVAKMKEHFHKSAKLLENAPPQRPKKQKAPVRLVENPLTKQA